MIVNVLDLGADPTGAVDSSGAFFNALNAINAARGGTLRIPAGAYRVDRHITNIGSNTRIEGAGIGVTKILERNMVDNPDVFTACLCGQSSDTEPLVNVEVCHLTVERDHRVGKPQDGVSFKGIGFRGTFGAPARNIRVHHAECRKVLSENFYADGFLRDVVFSNCRSIDGADGTTNSGNAFNFNVTNENALGCKIVDNFIQNCTNSAVLAGGDGLVVARNHICCDKRAMGGDAFVVSQANNILIEDNLFENLDRSNAAVSVMMIGFDHSTPNEKTSGIVRNNVIRNCVLPDSRNGAALKIARVLGELIVEHNEINNCHSRTSANKPSAITVFNNLADPVDTNVVLRDNKLKFGVGAPLIGINVGDTTKNSRVALQGNQFSGWPAQDRYRGTAQAITLPSSTAKKPLWLAIAGGGALLIAALLRFLRKKR